MARPLRLFPDPIAASRADRGRRHAACGRPADLHGPGRGGARPHPLAATERRRASPRRRRAITLPPIGIADPGSADRRAPTPTASRRASGSPRSTSTCRSSRARPDIRRATSRCTSRSHGSTALYQPGQGRATYLFAHARPGMFEPLLKTKAPDQRGSVVEVWTSDDQLFLYEIVEVRRGPDRPRRRDRRQYRATLAPDLGGPERDARQDPGHRQAAVQRTRRSRRRPPQGQAPGLLAEPRA